jgi:tRNA uridine 5-carboxymethylaminomethyl modification enzyme
MFTSRAEYRAIIGFAESYSIHPQYINSGLEALGTTPLSRGCKLVELIVRPQVSLMQIAELVPAFKAELDKITDSRKEEIIEAAEILIKYSGYIKREQIIADKIRRLENISVFVVNLITTPYKLCRLKQDKSLRE